MKNLIRNFKATKPQHLRVGYSTQYISFVAFLFSQLVERSSLPDISRTLAFLFSPMGSIKTRNDTAREVDLTIKTRRTDVIKGSYNLSAGT